MAESDNVVTGAPAVAPAGDMPLLTLRDYLQTTVRAGASDLFITVAAPPVVKVQGSFKALSRTPLSADDTKALAYSAMRAEQVLEFETTLECDMSLELAEVGRFRVNVFMQRGAVALVARYITFDIPDLARLGLTGAGVWPGGGGQIHLAGRHAGAPQCPGAGAYPDGGRPDRICPHPPQVAGEPARGGYRHPEF